MNEENERATSFIIIKCGRLLSFWRLFAGEQFAHSYTTSLQRPRCVRVSDDKTPRNTALIFAVYSTLLGSSHTGHGMNLVYSLHT